VLVEEFVCKVEKKATNKRGCTRRGEETEVDGGDEQ